MKPPIWIFLSIIVLVSTENPSAYESALKAISSIGVRLQALLEDGNSNSNFLVSPLSITTVIGQLMLGAEGQFRDELFELLNLGPTDANKNSMLNTYTEKNNETSPLAYSKFHMEMYSLTKTLEKSAKLFTLTQKNAVFFDRKLKLTKNFQSHSGLFYHSELTPLDFTKNPEGAQKVLNTWAERHTQGLIKNIFPAPPSVLTSAIFLNAIYFLADWEIPFSDLLNKVGEFRTQEDAYVDVTYMLGAPEGILYTETDQYKMIALPYKDGELDMFMLLPRKDSPYKYDIRKFAESLKATDIEDAIKQAKLRDVNVKIPKMSLSSSVSVLEPLLRYKARKDAQSNQKEPAPEDTNSVNVTKISKESYPEILLTGAVENGNLRISDIIQEMVFSINEKGTEAAAVALGSIQYNGVQKQFFADRPFVFFIRHRSTTATLFWGTISNPSG